MAKFKVPGNASSSQNKLLNQLSNMFARAQLAGLGQSSNPQLREGYDLVKSAVQSEKLVRPSNLGADNPNTPKPSDARKGYIVGAEAAIAERKKAENFLTGLDRSSVPSDYAFAINNFLFSNSKRIKDLQNKQNISLNAVANDRASQRDAIAANQAILSGRKPRKSSATVPRLPRAAGLLIPTDQRLI